MNHESSLEGAICLLPDADQDIEGIDRLSRRKFLKVGMGALASLALLEMGGAGFLFLRARSLEGAHELHDGLSRFGLEQGLAGHEVELPDCSGPAHRRAYDVQPRELIQELAPAVDELKGVAAART